MTRKYRQKGYMDHDNDPKKKRPLKDQLPFRQEPQRVTVKVIKCYNCGNVIKDGSQIKFEDTCSKCDSDLRICVNCIFFDTSSHFQCQKPITQSVASKNKRNKCTFFSPHASLETRFVNMESQSDARKAFENLFKK